MRVYKFPPEGFVTVHDLADHLKVWRQSVHKWIKLFSIPVIHVHHGNKKMIAFVPERYLDKLRERSDKFRKHNKFTTRSATSSSSDSRTRKTDPTISSREPLDGK